MHKNLTQHPHRVAFRSYSWKNAALISGAVLMMASLAPFSMQAEIIRTEEWIDGVKYDLDTEAQTAASVVYKTDRTEINIPSVVTYKGEDYTVTKIGGSNMYGASLETLTIPDSATEILSDAFKSAGNLKTVNFGTGITSIGEYAFYETSIETLDLPGALQSIGSNAFSENTALVSVSIPDEAPVEIGASAFYNCTGLKDIYIGKSVKTYGQEILSGCESLETITYNAADCVYSGWIRMIGLTWRTSVKKIIFGDDVVKIPNSLCAGTPSLTEVTFGKSVATLGGGCFSNSDGIKTVYFNSVNYTPETDVETPTLGSLNNFGLSNIETIIFGDEVTKIPDYLCYNCYNVTKIVLPANLETIGKYAFATTKVEDLDFPESLKEIGESAFYVNSLTGVVIPANVTKIGDSAFAGTHLSPNTSLKSIVISDEASVEIGYGAFGQCEALEDIYIGKSTVSIATGAFSCYSTIENVQYNAIDCKVEQPSRTEGEEKYYSGILTSKVKKINIGDEVKSLPAYLFAGAASVEEITVGPAVEKIGVNALKITKPEETPSILYYNAVDCAPVEVSEFSYGSILSSNGVTSLVIGEGVTAIPDRLFSYGSLTEAKISDSVERIGDYAFCINYNLENITIPDNVKELGTGCFYGTDLADVTLGNGLTALNDSTFANSRLISLTIPDGISAIGKEAFKNNRNLTEVTFGKGLTYIGENAFENCSAIAKVTVPDLDSWTAIEFASVTSNPTNFAKNLYIGETPARRITISEGVEKISDYAFINCGELINVTMPSGIKEAGLQAFAGCNKLQKIIFPSEEALFGVEYAGLQNLFTYSNKAALYIGDETLDREEYTIPEWMTEIPSFAFYGCSSLKNVRMHEGVESIGQYAFRGCQLEDVVMHESITRIGQQAFGVVKGNVFISDVNKWACIDFEDEYSNPIKSSDTFTVGEKTDPVRHLEIEGVDNISPFAFINAWNLASVRVKECKSIGSKAFGSCFNLENICIDAEEIGEEAFSFKTHTDNPVNVYCVNAEPPVAPDNTFPDYENAILYVPEGSISLYENAPTCWWQFIDIRETDFADLDAIFAPDYENGLTGAELLPADTADTSGNTYYTLQGVRVNADRLAPGIYIRRSAGKTTKIIIK